MWFPIAWATLPASRLPEEAFRRGLGAPAAGGRGGALIRLLRPPALLPPAPEQEEHTERDTDQQEAPEDRHAGVDAAEGQRHELDDAPAQREQGDDEQDAEQDPARPQPYARARRRRDQAHEAQRQQLAVGGRRLAELLGRHLQV